MKATLSFLGAAQNVTGSRYLLEANGSRILIDCGLYQERNLRSRNWDPFPVPAKSIDAVLVTHAHLDHCGLLPKLVREGFHGKIHCTAATSEISQIVLMDSAHIQEEDAAYKAKRHRREGRAGKYGDVPLYTAEDAGRVLPLFSRVRYEKPIELAKGIEATFHNIGHILGASSIKITINGDGPARSLLFSGDVGRWGRPILRDPTLVKEADYVVIESTYGNRDHEAATDVKEALAEVINSTHAAGGNLVIPSFALERSQDVLYQLNELLLEDRVPNLMVFMDSPMAINVTEVFERHPELYDEEMTEHINNHHSPFEFPGLKMTRATNESKAINHIKGTVVIIAGSGMCTGGRVKHHLANNITRRESTILFVGYQAVGTLGRIIEDGAEEVRIFGRTWPVEARIARIHGFSAHAGRSELMQWLGGLASRPRQVFVTHGEPSRAAAFAEHIRQHKGWDVTVPSYKDKVKLD